MATIILVRHALHDLVNKVLVGRNMDISLSPAGHQQAAALAERLASASRIQSSPQRRAHETATPIARRAGLPVETCEALDEIDFGEWRGLSFEALSKDSRWSDWNERRASAVAPKGESALHVQRRMLDHILAARTLDRDGTFVMVSHAEPIRSAALGLLGLSMDAWDRVEIAPASMTTVAVDARGPRLITLNATAC